MNRGILRCSDLYAAGPPRCHQITPEYAFTLSASPDGELVAYVFSDGHGVGVRIITSEGTAPRVLVHSASACRPVWSGVDTLWVSVRTAERTTWVEFDVKNGRPTGRRSPGSTECLDHQVDPLSPVMDPIRILTRVEWEVRTHPTP